MKTIRPNNYLVIFLKKFISLLLFVVIVVFYIFHQLINWLFSRKYSPSILKNKLRPKFNSFYDRLIAFLDPEPDNTFNRSYLIELSLNNMKAKKTRTLITIGGMAISISFIVILISIGYGLQNLIITRVARLEELKQTEVLPGMTADLLLDEATMSKFKNISNVETVLPIISVVGKVSYKQSVSDMAVYGVTTDYLKNSAIQPIKGKIFEDSNVTSTNNQGEVYGISTDNLSEKKIDSTESTTGEVEFEIQNSAWLKVRKETSSKSELIGYTRRIEGIQTGTEITGDSFMDDNDKLSDKWIEAIFPLWQKTSCDSLQNSVCEDSKYLPITDDAGGQVQSKGFTAKISMQVNTSGDNVNTQVLGESTDILPIVEIASESANSIQTKKKVSELSPQAKRVVVINRSVLKVLDINENEAIDQKINLSFVVVGDLVDNQHEQIESIPVEYTIIGITPDTGTPIIYVPFMDLKSLGITNFSQIKVIVNQSKNLSTVRSAIESGGYGTVSVVDTVSQIDKLFGNLRLLLLILGMVALTVAALGMFNTLTVSLLERTREIGLMKAMGMKSNEVKELFLTESMIIGFSGGVIGLFFGTLLGNILSLILTAFSILKGIGSINITYLPAYFVFTVLILSIIVGILTGYFPARRATKISALNALRYE